MRTRLRILVGIVLAFALIAAACGDDDSGAETTTTTSAPETTTTAAETTTTAATTTTTAAPLPPLVIWADETRSGALENVVPAFTAATGVDVEIQIVDFGEIRNQVQVAGPAGEGPDLFVGAHDWVGELASNGVLEPIDLGGRESEFFQTALDVFTFNGTLYGLPYSTEAIALYYNADLVPTPPATFEEIEGICDGLDGISNCVGIPGGADGPDAYHNYPFVSALGGYIFAYNDGVYDTSDIGLDSDGAVAGIEFLKEQVDAGVIGSVNYDTAKNLFFEGTEPFWITGPWEIGNLNETDLNWAVAKLPTIGGNAPAPFVGANAFFMSSFSDNKAIATSFLLDFVATNDTMRALYDADPRNPAYIPTFDAIKSDPVAETFALSAADGVPMPNVPEMGNVWGPLGDNIAAVRNGDLDASTAMTQAATAVAEAIAGG